MFTLPNNLVIDLYLTCTYAARPYNDADEEDEAEDDARDWSRYWMRLATVRMTAAATSRSPP